MSHETAPCASCLPFHNVTSSSKLRLPQSHRATQLNTVAHSTIARNQVTLCNSGIMITDFLFHSDRASDLAFGSWMPAGMKFCILQAALRSKTTEAIFHCEAARKLLREADDMSREADSEPGFWPRFVHKGVHENRIRHCLGSTGISHCRAGQIRREEIPYLCTSSRRIGNRLKYLVTKTIPIACLVTKSRSSCC